MPPNGLATSCQRAQESATTTAARRKVAGDAGEIAQLATHLAYDTSNLQTATLPVAILHQRIVLLLPVVSGAADRIRSLREIDGITPPLRAVLDRMSTSDPGRPPRGLVGSRCGARRHRRVGAADR